MAGEPIKVYSDYKSPYAFLVKDLVDDLARKTGATFDWLPYTLDIPSYLGSAEVDQSGSVVRESRNAHQWRRVKYSYMDCRREANRRGLTIRGPKKIFDSTLANIGMLFAKREDVFHDYHDRVFEQFWRRELDIENLDVMVSLLAQCGADADQFTAFSAGEGRDLLEQIQVQAEAAGVFGVPSFLFADGDLYWGREHIDRVREIITAGS